MPKPPGYIDKVNAVIKFIQNPCDAPWTVYFETALEPAGHVVIALLAFGMDDVIRGFFRPKGLRSLRHGRKGRRSAGRLPGSKGIPEIGEMIGSNLPGAEEAKGRKVTQGVKNLWLLDGVIQRGLWHWLVADLTINFFFEWTSLIQSTEYCSRKDYGRCLATADSGAQAALLDWQAQQCPLIEYKHGDCGHNNSSGSVGPGTWSVAFSLRSKNNGLTPQLNEIRIRQTFPYSAVLGQSDVVFVGPLGEAEMVCTADLVGPAHFTFESRLSFGFASTQHAAHMIFGQSA